MHSFFLGIIRFWFGNKWLLRPSKEQGDRIASLCLANPSTRVLQSNFQKDGEEDEDEEEDGEKDEEEDEDNVTNNNANYAAKENYSENNCIHSNDFIEVTYINRL